MTKTLGRPKGSFSLSPAQIRHCARLRREGMTYRAIETLTGIPHPTVYRACLAFSEAAETIRQSATAQEAKIQAFIRQSERQK